MYDNNKNKGMLLPTSTLRNGREIVRP